MNWPCHLSDALEQMRYLAGINMSRARAKARNIALHQSATILLIAGLNLCVLSSSVHAGSLERAKRIHDRLAGVPPSDQILNDMADLIDVGDVRSAADIAMQDEHFYDTVLKNFITPWTNEAQTAFAPLNDYTATVIGIIRDRRSFKEVLTGDIIYVGRTQNPSYSFDNNRHYEALESSGDSLKDPLVLERRLQSQLATNWLNPQEAAGVTTTRAAGKAFFSDGTNRRMFRYMAMNYLCRDMEALQDNTRPTDRIRQDVSRSPGGDSEIFLNTCSGCHSGMDPMSGAFAYFEWVPGGGTSGRVEYTRGTVQEKYLINANTFPFGHIAEDDRWDNYWRVSANSVLGWRGTATGGYGPKSLGQQVADSEGFSRCQVQKVFKQVCFREPSDIDDRNEVETIRQDFESNGYDMMNVFADVADYCSEGL
jgi:hypothetical protein